MTKWLPGTGTSYICDTRDDYINVLLYGNKSNSCENMKLNCGDRSFNFLCITTASRNNLYYVFPKKTMKQVPFQYVGFMVDKII
jgi:hypothetical protein